MVTDDGDVLLTEPDNMQIEENLLHMYQKVYLHYHLQKMWKLLGQKTLY